MGEKSEKKKKFILQRAKEVFCAKGYREVTMKDIVDACNISRGGLYLYFSSTEELFLEVLRLDMAESDDVFAGKIGEHSTATDILLLFLREQKKELLRKKDSLSVATYEYLFSKRMPKSKNPLGRQFIAASVMLQKLLETGIRQGEFICDDPEEAARNIMYVLSGLKIQSAAIGITGDEIDRALAYSIQNLVAEDESEEG